MEKNTMYMGGTMRSESGETEEMYEQRILNGSEIAGEACNASGEKRDADRYESADPDGEQKFYLCSHCGNLIGMLNDSGIRIRCCGNDMERLYANAQGDLKENLPKVRLEGREVTVDAGNVPHSVGRSDHMGWAYIQTDLGGHRQVLNADGPKKAEFTLNEKVTVPPCAGLQQPPRTLGSVGCECTELKKGVKL